MQTEDMQLNGMGFPTGTDLKNVTVLGRGDWERIQFQLNKRVIEQEKMRKIREEKEKLHEISKEAVKNWTNTVKVSIHYPLPFDPIFNLNIAILSFTKIHS